MESFDANQRWALLSEQWNKIEESGKKHTQVDDMKKARKDNRKEPMPRPAVFTPKTKKGTRGEKKRKDIGLANEDAGASTPGTFAGAANIAGKAIVPSDQDKVTQAGVPDRLNKKGKIVSRKINENTMVNGITTFSDLNKIKPPAQPEEGSIENDNSVENVCQEQDITSIISSLKTRYPESNIYICVYSPEGYEFSDTDQNIANEIKSSCGSLKDIGGAWIKKGETDSESQEISESYPSSFGQKDNETEETEEENEDEIEDSEKTESDDEDNEIKDDDKENTNVEKNEKEYVTSDCISLTPEQWSNFLVKADSTESEEIQANDIDLTNKEK